MDTVRVKLKYGYFEFPKEVFNQMLFEAMPLLHFEDWEYNKAYGWRKKTTQQTIQTY